MIEIGSIIWGAENVARTAEFWSKALDYEIKYFKEDDWAILLPKEGDGIQFCVSKVTSPKARRHHMDLFADDKEKEVERLISLGAARKVWTYCEDPDYTVLMDPDGNPFCVVQK